jgi:hypothetical protein
VTGQRSRTALAAGIGLYLAAGPTDSFVTVPQRDKGRSLIGPASVDVSADGRFVAFEALAPLVPADTDAGRDIYVLDRTTGHVTFESPTPSWSTTMHPRLSGDGRHLVFEAESWADDGPRVRMEVVLCDRWTRTTTLLRSASGDEALNGSSHSPDISDDGRVVAFTSSATNVASGADANGPAEDVYALDVQSMVVRRVSVDTNGAQPAQGFSFAPKRSSGFQVQNLCLPIRCCYCYFSISKQDRKMRSMCVHSFAAYTFSWRADILCYLYLFIFENCFDSI